MEDLERTLRWIGHLGSNVTDSTIQRVGLCLCKLVDIKRTSSTNIPVESGHHSSRSTKDLMVILEQLNNSSAFTQTVGRQHSQFLKMKGNVAAVI